MPKNKLALALEMTNTELRKLQLTKFQNFDQKANQMMNLLSAVVKTLNEMASIGSGDKSGL